MKYIKSFNEGKEPKIKFKEENGIYYKCNPAGGKWVKTTKSQYDRSIEKTNQKNKSLFSKFGDKVVSFLGGDPIEIGELNDTDKKYTEKDVFNLTEESFKLGYSRGDIERSYNIKADMILNDHKKWWNRLKNGIKLK